MTLSSDRLAVTTCRCAHAPDNSQEAETARRLRHVLHVFPTFAIGGVPLRIANIVNRLGSSYRHTILALDGRYDSFVRIDETADAVRADLDVPRMGALAMTRFATRTLREREPDMLATYNWGAIEWALANTLLQRRRHVHFESGFGPEEADRQIARRAWTRRIALSGATGLVVPSLTLERMARDVWHIDASKVRRVPNGIDTRLYQKAVGKRSAFGVEKRPGEIIVGTVAPLRREKNIERLLHAFAGIGDIGRPLRLVIAGDGSERQGLERLSRSLGIDGCTEFLGHVDAVEDVLALLDLFVISSDTEQMPNTLLQAMAAGCAVASVDVGDIAVMVAVENRPFIVPRDDLMALSGAIVALLNDDVGRMQIGSANRTHVESAYSMENMVAAYRTLYDGQIPELLAA